MHPHKCVLFFLLVSFSFSSFAQRITGPVIQDYGATFEVENPDFKPDPDQVYRVVFDIHSSPEDPAQVNPILNTLARFLNMHAAAGVPPENLKVAGVIHNQASKDALNNEAYRDIFGLDNPNLPLMEALTEAGAEIYLCGQSMHARGVPKEKMAKPVKTALSAMTVFLTLGSEGYTLIRF
jgi:intracellular sulfur oxidation DsrE/DsrF family protein